MEHTLVLSTVIRSVGYDPGRQVLEIRFRSGSLYAYSNVPADVAEALLEAPSVGTYFDAYIRDAGYAYTRVE